MLYGKIISTVIRFFLFPHKKIIVATFFTAKMIVVEFIIYVGKKKTAYAMDIYSPITIIDLLPL